MSSVDRCLMLNAARWRMGYGDDGGCCP